MSLQEGLSSPGDKTRKPEILFDLVSIIVMSIVILAITLDSTRSFK